MRVVMFRRPILLLLPFLTLLAGCFDFDMSNHRFVAPIQTTTTMPPATVTPVDVSGTWYARIDNNAVNCGFGEYVDAQTVVITQDGAAITMLTSTGNIFMGTVNGDIVEWDGTYLERGGSSEYTAATLVFSTDSGSGNAAWTWSDGTDSCNGTMVITVARDIASRESHGNSVPESAAPFEFADNVAYFSGSLGDGGDSTDYFRFTAAADGVVQAELSHFDTLTNDIDLLIQDEELNWLSASRNPDTFEIVEAQVEAGKDYYIRVKARSITGEVFYNLSIDIN
jgi:hypothetical protein